jgi:fatty-acid desaturase
VFLDLLNHLFVELLAAVKFLTDVNQAEDAVLVFQIILMTVGAVGMLIHLFYLYHSALLVGYALQHFKELLAAYTLNQGLHKPLSLVVIRPVYLGRTPDSFL